MWPPRTSSLLPQAIMACPAHGGSGWDTGAKASAAASPFCEGVGGADLAGPLTGVHVSVSSAKIHTSPRYRPPVAYRRYLADCFDEHRCSNSTSK